MSLGEHSDFGSSDDDSDEEGENLVCKTCAKEFISSEKGCSAFKSVCASCSEKEKALVTDDDIDQPAVDVNENADENDDDTKKPDENASEQGTGTEELPAAEAPTTVSAEATTADVDPYYKRYLDLYLSCTGTVSSELAGSHQTWVQKRYRMDSAQTSLIFFLDLEFLDKCPLLTEHLVLAAVANKHHKMFSHARVVVVDSIGRKFIVAAILRTKCVGPRYCVVLVTVADWTKIFRVDISKFRADYTAVPSDTFDHEQVMDAVIAWFHETGLAWDPNGSMLIKDNVGRSCPTSKHYAMLEDMVHDITGDDGNEDKGAGGRKRKEPSYFYPTDITPVSKKASTSRRGGNRGGTKKKAAATAATKQVRAGATVNYLPLTPLVCYM